MDGSKKEKYFKRSYMGNYAGNPLGMQLELNVDCGPLTLQEDMTGEEQYEGFAVPEKVLEAIKKERN